MAKNRVGVARVTDEQIAAMANTGVSDASVDQTIAERSGSDDKVGAAEAEAKGPKIKTLMSEAADWVNRDPYGLKRVGLYGQRNRFALRYEDLERRARFLGRSLTVADLEELHGLDTTAPDSMVCTSSGETITSFVRTAMINDEGDLMRDQNGNIVYRGQFVVTGKPLAVHAARVGEDLYKLRNARGKRKDIQRGNRTISVADLLPSQSFDQANARLAGINGHFSARNAENQAFKSRLGFTMNEALGGGRTTDEHGIDRGSFAPKTPRGQHRKQQRWADDRDAS